MHLSLRALLVATVMFAVVSGAKSYSTDPASETNNQAATPTSAPASPSPPASAEASTLAKKASDDASVLQSTVAIAASAIDRAAKYQKSINEITGSNSRPSQSTPENMQTLVATVVAIQQNNPIGALGDAKKNLTSAQSATADSCGALAKITASQQDVSDASAKCKKAQSDAGEKSAQVDAAISGLQSALASIGPYLAQQFDNLAIRLKPFSDKSLVAAPGGTAPSGTPDASVVLQVLPKGLPALSDVLQTESEYVPAWNSMKPAVQSAIKAVPAPSAPQPDADAELQKLQATTDSIQKGLAAWFTSVSGKLQTDAQSLDGKIALVESDPAKNSADALGDVRDKSDTLASAQSVADAWPPIIGFLVDGQPVGFSLSTTKKGYADLQKWANVLRASISRVHDALAGDFNNSDADQVSLYYFTDVPRLMYALNENVQTVGGVADAQAKAADQRNALIQSELELADAQATVNRYQKQVLDLQEQQRQANEKLKGLNSSVSKLASRLKQAQDKKTNADNAYQAAVDKQNANPSDPTSATAVDKAKVNQTSQAAKVSDAQSNYDQAKNERDTAQTQADATQNDKDSLPAKLDAAKQALSDAQTAVSQERRKMLLAAQAESDAFAFARDNTPFLYAVADASSPNPAKRVMLYAFNDSKTIFMRGKPEDLAIVKHIISVFDTPAPLARLTLWTFQLDADSNGKTNEKAANSLNASMEIVDEELSQTRALENTTLSLLRDVINQEVRTCFKKTEALQATAAEAELFARSECAEPIIKNQADCHGCTIADLAKIRRITFYDPLVLDQLGMKDGQLDLEKLRGLVPDPAGTTTLGEALMILTLAPLRTRLAVRDDFEHAVQERLRRLPLSKGHDHCAWFRPDPNNPDERYDALCQDNPKVSHQKPCANGECLLQLTWHGLDIWENGVEGSGRGLTSSQLEITRALLTAYRGKQLRMFLDKLAAEYTDVSDVSARLASLSVEQSRLQEQAKGRLSSSEAQRLASLHALGRSQNEREKAEEQKLVDKGITLLPAADEARYRLNESTRLALEARLCTVKTKSVAVVQGLQGLGVDAGDLVSRLGAATTDDEIKKSLLAVKILAYQSPSLSSASPRVAAADQMLKEIIIGLEDDLDRLFIQPMINDLRTRLTAAKVRVGILQRESMLATNRGKARVDPKASAQLAVGEEQDILTGVQQLAQLYATVQSGGALAALGALQQQPREQQPEIYALTTGNKFEVTPVFDPSGQALRFKFDFVSTTNLQEPNGTTNPQFPRVERHTVNTEVQLSNLETREISRFESNARLGLPTTYWGGIPVFKDIPYVRPWIPLVGWFVRKAGSNASAQQSVIFGQTTMYPTIGNIINLLADIEPSENTGATEQSK